MDCDLCSRYEDEAVSFVLGDMPAERRAETVAHLDSCGTCRREVATLAAALDALSASITPMEPSAGFVERVLTAADVAGLTYCGPPEVQARPRAVTVVLRRRRTLAALSGATALLSLMGLAFHTWILLGPAVAAAVLDAAYLGLMIAITHTRARNDITESFRVPVISEDAYWRSLELELMPAAVAADDPSPVRVVEVDNTSLFRFAFSYFLGWALTPLVGMIRLLRGDLTGLEQSPVLDYIVALQRRGRAQSLKLLVAGATSVAVVGGGAATVLMAPGLAAAAPAQTYTVHQGDTLSGIAARFGVPTADLVQLNGIADPNSILPGEVIQVSAAASGPTAGSGSYTVQTGDTLDSIAEHFGTTAAALASANHISNPNLIYTGQTLILDASTAPTTAPAAPTPSGGSSSGSTPITVSAPVSSSYVNPFDYGSWSPARIDEGVDWIPNSVSPVVAIGDGVVTYSSMESGWPAGGFISYRLTSGSHAGLYIYVAEHITNLAPVGTVVSAGEQIATALPGYPWTEWGWAAAEGPEPAPGSQYGGAADGTATAGGKAFARFLISLGAAVVENPGPGPTTP